MTKYWLIVRGIMQETLMYRLNFAMWRLRGVLQFLALYYLWIALVPPGKVLFEYNQSLILTYMFFGNVIGALIFSTRAAGVGEEINNGNLSNYLLRPINYFLVWAATDVGDKAMNVFFAIFEFTILFFILRPPLFLQTNIVYLFLAIVSTLIAVTLFFFISMLLGAIGFWSNEVWAPRFIFVILIQFFSGSFFPLDILPSSLYIFFLATPFPYLLYIPLKIYLGQTSIFEIFSGLFISLFWTTACYFMLKTVWAKGLRVYTAQGR